MSDLEIAFTVIGWIGTVNTSACFLPAVIKTFKTHNTSGQSLLMWAMEVFGGIVWILDFVLIACNGAALGAWLPTLIVNVFIFSFSVPMLGFKIYNMHRAKKFNTTELAFVIKSDNRIAKFNTEKLRTNIEQSFTSHNKVIDPKKIDAITNDILKDLAKYSNNGKITSAQIKDFLVKHLKKNTN